MKKNASVICAIGLASLAGSASAITLTNTDLQGLTYSPNGNATAGYVSTGPTTGFANLTSQQRGSQNDTATVSVPNGYDGVSLGTLSSLLAAGAAGNVSFNLLSVSGLPGGNSVNWQVTLADPNNTAIKMTFDTVNADPDKTGGNAIIGANPFNLGGSTFASSSTLEGNIGQLWTTVAGFLPVVGDPSLASWNVTSIGVLMPDFMQGEAPGVSADAEIGSFTLPDGGIGISGNAASTPDGGATLPLLAVCFGALAGLRRRLHRAQFLTM